MHLPHRLAAVDIGSAYDALPHCPWAVGSGTTAMHRHLAWAQWALELM